MSRRPVSLLPTAALAVGALIMAAGPALAQRGGHSGGGFGYGRGFYGYSRGSYGGFFPGFYGYGVGLGRGFYGYGYGPAYTSGSSGYVANATGYSSPVVSGYYSPPADAAPSAVVPAGYGTGLTDNAAHIRMRLPADAEVWFGEVKTSQTGPVRDFVSPPLDTTKSCFYRVRARWTVNGRPVEQTREVSARANTWMVVDFTRPAEGRDRLPASVGW
jgi:uncharacterized protein (TIGR03000 family)